MKSTAKLSLIVTAVLVLTTFSACKKYLDVNQNPNNPEDVDIILLLPSAEAAIAHPLGYNFAVYGGFWSQYWTQSPSSSQYRTIDSYSPPATDIDRPWGNLYNDALTDLKDIETKGNQLKRYNYVGISKILQAYTYQLLTDNFGDVPFSEAIKAKDGIFNAHYDSQESIYTGIIQMAKDAIAEFDKGSLVVPGDDDLIYKGDMETWKAFANTLLLKMYLRISDVKPSVSQAGIAALEASGAVFLDEGETAQIIYTTTGGSQHPAYEAALGLNSVHDIYASSTALNELDNLSDPRIDIFYTAGAGIPQGGYFDPSVTASGKAEPGSITGANVGLPASATAPVKFMSDYESYFLQAEAVARGWMTGDAGDLYNEAIYSSFNTYGLDTTGYMGQTDVMWPTSGGLTDKLKAIAFQKWLSFCGTQNIEAWTETRRFDYPVFSLSQAASGIVGGKLPARLFYPSTELTTNANFPGQKKVTDKVWWDKF